MAKKNDEVNGGSESIDVAAMKKQLDDVCAKVRRMSDNWKAFAVKFIGATDDGKMSGRASVGLAIVLLAASLVGIGVSYARDVWNVGSTTIGTAKVTTSDAGTATLEVDAVLASVSGAIAGTTVSASGLMTLTPTAASVTNGQAITVAASHYTLNGIGGANDSTNTITLAGASASGQVLVMTVALASTNLITIADSAPVYASGAVLMDAGDSCMFVSVGTNWVLVCESDN